MVVWGCCQRRRQGGRNRVDPCGDRVFGFELHRIGYTQQPAPHDMCVNKSREELFQHGKGGSEEWHRGRISRKKRWRLLHSVPSTTQIVPGGYIKSYQVVTWCFDDVRLVCDVARLPAGRLPRLHPPGRDRQVAVLREQQGREGRALLPGRVCVPVRERSAVACPAPSRPRRAQFLHAFPLYLGVQDAL